MSNWFDARAIVLSLMLAVAAALPRMTTSVERRDYYFFDITLTSSSVGTTQVFWDIGRKFNEFDSSRQPLKIEPDPVVYRYMLPMGKISALRFDPIDGIGDFTLSAARIVDYRGRLVHAFGPEDLVPFQGILKTERHGDTLEVQTARDSHDPIFNLRLPRPLLLRSNARIWFELGWPVALPVFLAGCLLGLPVVARRLRGLAGAAWRRLARHPGAAVAATAGLAVAIQCHPVLFLGRSFASPNNGSLMLYGQLPTLPGETEYMFTNTMSSDTGALLFQHLYYPIVQHEALRHGELPLWNRYSLCGEPLLGQGQSMFGDPFNFLTIFADGAAWAWDVRFLLAHWILAAGLGYTVWRLTRHLGAALLVTIGGAFVAFFTFRLVHPANFSVCYAPTILLAWVGLLQAAGPRRLAGWLGALILANWLVLTSGTIKEAYMLIACLNLAGALLLFLLPETRGRRGRLLALSGAAGLGLVLLAAPLWISFLVAWKHSFTGYDSPYVQSLPLPHLLGFFDDIFYRQTTYDENVIAPALNFLLLLGVLWWLARPALWREDRAGSALVLAAVPPVALGFGVVPDALILKIPFVGNIGHVGNSFSCALLVIAAVLAGCGFRDALVHRATPGWWSTAGRMLLLGGALAAVFLLTTRENHFSSFFCGYAPALALGAIALPLGLRWAAETPARPGPLCVALAFALPLLLWRHCQYGASFFDHYAFVPGYRSDLHAPSPAVAAVNQRQTEPGRVVGWGTNLFPSYNTVLRWEGLYGVDAVRNPYYHELAYEFGLKRVWVWDWANDEAGAASLVPAHDFLNVTDYVATHGPAPREIAGLRLQDRKDLDLYTSPKAWPRAFFCDRVDRYDTVGEFAAMIRGGDGRPFAAAARGEPGPGDRAGAPPERTVRAAHGYRLTPNTTSFTIEAPGPGVAVLTEAYYAEDFHVTINGQPAPYFRVNHAFKGVAIPAAGTYEITFAYWPQHFTLALGLSAAGALLLAAGGRVLLGSGASATGHRPKPIRTGRETRVTLT